MNKKTIILFLGGVLALPLAYVVVNYDSKPCDKTTFQPLPPAAPPSSAAAPLPVKPPALSVPPPRASPIAGTPLPSGTSTQETAKATLAEAPPPSWPAEATGLDESSRFEDLLAQLRAGDTNGALAHAQRLLASEQPLLRAVGYALLQEAGALDESALTQLAQDPSLVTPLTVLEWLRDQGREDAESQLEILLRERLQDPGELLDILSTGELQLGGNRSIIWMLRGLVPEEELNPFYQDLARDGAQSYETRMKALFELRFLAPPDQYPALLSDLAAQTAPEESWREPLRAFAERNRLLHSRHPDGPVLKPADVQELLASPSPYRLQDLALTLEYLTEHPQSLLASGCLAQVQAGLQALTNQTLSGPEQQALRRVQSLQDKLETIEATRPAP